MKTNKWLTLLAGLVMVIVAAVYFTMYEPKQQQQLIAVPETTEGFTKALTYYQDENTSDRFYNVSSSLLMNKKIALNEGDVTKIIKQIEQTPQKHQALSNVRDVWLQMADDQWAYVKFGEAKAGYVMQDMATGEQYALAAPQQKKIEKLLAQAEPSMSFLVSLIVFVGLLVVAMIVTEGYKFIVLKKATAVVEKKSKTSDEFFIPLGLFFAAILSADIYGGYHVFIVAATMLVILGLADVKENKFYLPLNLLLTVITVVYLFLVQLLAVN